MHVAFIPYGKKEWVEKFIAEMEAQKHKLRLFKDGKEKTFLYIDGQVRILPFGVYEYVFPREDLDMVLSTLTPAADNYNISEFKMGFLRRALKLKKIPKFNKGALYLWRNWGVSCIIIGIREDVDITENTGEYAGYEHEAI